VAEGSSSTWLKTAIRMAGPCCSSTASQIVSPFVREQLSTRAVKNDDVLQNITVPALFTHGDKDEVILPWPANSTPH
jgi:pimeloyl-ACP methyl ester carboxylesterase